jgi:hypothetical protein
MPRKEILGPSLARNIYFSYSTVYKTCNGPSGLGLAKALPKKTDLALPWNGHEQDIFGINSWALFLLDLSLTRPTKCSDLHDNVRFKEKTCKTIKINRKTRTKKTLERKLKREKHKKKAWKKLKQKAKEYEKN